MKHGWLVAAVFIALLSGYAGFLHAQEEWVSAAQWLRCVSFDASYLDASRTPEERAEAVLSRMTRAEKIGQMALIEKNSLQDLSDLSRYHLGAVLSGFGAKPEPNTPEAWQDMISRLNTQTKETCLQIPLLYGVDAIHGHAGVMGATIFPHAIGLAAAYDKDLVKRIAQATAAELKATGIYWNFAPNLDVAKEMRWGRVYETYGSNTETVSSLGVEYLRGLQGSSTSIDVLATPKHFVANGEALWGTSVNMDYRVDQANVVVSENVLRNVHVQPFKKAIEEGAQSIMVGLNAWQNKRLTEHEYLLTKVLKEELGFSGFLVSDWYGVYALPYEQEESLARAVNAGVDMVMLPFDYKAYSAMMERLLDRGDISEERLNDAVRRILRVKFRLGLFDREAPVRSDLAVFRNNDHQRLAREAVQKSQTLLKNTHHTLPIPASTSRIFVAGSAADNLGKQSGGWTIEWQGIDGNWIPGTTILEGIKQVASSSTRVEFKQDGHFPGEEFADVRIAVIGEKPYAEGVGDDAYPRIEQDDVEAVKELRARVKKLVVIVISGRPLDVAPYVHEWDALVASWLPGSEGAGVADVLFGRAPFTGKAPILWSLDRVK